MVHRILSIWCKHRYHTKSCLSKSTVNIVSHPSNIPWIAPTALFASALSEASCAPAFIWAQSDVGLALEELQNDRFGDGVLEMERFVTFDQGLGLGYFLQRGNQMRARATSRTHTTAF